MLPHKECHGKLDKLITYPYAPSNTYVSIGKCQTNYEVVFIIDSYSTAEGF